MSNLYENIIFLCKSRGIKGGKMCTDIGMSKGILTDLKMGRQAGLSITNAQRIAKYFGITVEELYGEVQKEQPTVQDEPVSPKMAELIAQIKKLPEEKIDLLLRVAESIQLQ